MTSPLSRIHDDHKPPPELIAKCIRQLDDWFAKLDEGEAVVVIPWIFAESDVVVTGHAWMATCIYLMAMCEPTSAELRELSYALDRQSKQPSLF